MLPAIALTAFARAKDRADALAAGFQEHMVKPVEPAALIALVGSLKPARAGAPRG
jgi:CheY-like chemotaxis protein